MLGVVGGVRQVGKLVSQSLVIRGHEVHLITARRVA
jgi:hypothetical protein